MLQDKQVHSSIPETLSLRYMTEIIETVKN